MAAKPTKAELAKDAPSSEPERRSPMTATVVLLVGFLLLAIAGVFTVVVPEISDAGDEDAAEAEPSSDPPSAEGAAPVSPAGALPAAP